MSKHRGQTSGSDFAGQALAEFAITIPIVLLVFMGIFDFARVAFAFNAVSDAARNGVREAIVDQDCKAIEDRARGSAPAVDLSASDAIQVTIYKDTTVTTTPAPDTCTGGSLPGGYGVGYVAEVTVTAQFNTITPIISQIIGPLSLTSTARLPIERVSHREQRRPMSSHRQYSIRRNHERGQVMVLVALGIVAMLAVVGLDTGRRQRVRAATWIPERLGLERHRRRPGDCPKPSIPRCRADRAEK